MATIKPFGQEAPDAGHKPPPIVLKEVYEQRFDEADQARKEAIWRELGRYLQRYIAPSARVVDIACDLGYFIRNIRAGERWATDIRDVGATLPPDVRFIRASGLDLAEVLPYTTKSMLPQHPLLVRAYLHLPPAWLIFGKQTLYLGEKPS